MAYTTIKKPSDYFNTKLYTGNGSTNAITGVNFQPDWVWLKDRDNATNQMLFDSVRGTGKELHSQNNDSETTQANTLTAFGSDGFSLGSNTDVNNSSQNFVSWNWLGANGTSANTDGSISSTVSANTTAGFSIVSYTGNGTASTIGHGLSAVPQIIIIKQRDNDGAWNMYNANLGNNKAIELNGTGAVFTTDIFNDTTPTSSVFSVKTSGHVNTNNSNYIAYCFNEVQGFSKFGSYVGNGNADGTFVYTGFKPAFVMIKLSTAADDWQIFDNKRNTFNIMDKYLRPNSSLGTVTNAVIDFTSNGFKLRSSAGSFNPSGGTAIYMAFAEEPLVGDNPCTAR